MNKGLLEYTRIGKIRKKIFGLKFCFIYFAVKPVLLKAVFFLEATLALGVVFSLGWFEEEEEFRDILGLDTPLECKGFNPNSFGFSNF